MRFRPLIVSSLLLGAPAAAPAQTPAGFTAAWRGTAEFFHATLTREGVVGGSLWFLRGDSVLAREFHGLADQETGRKVDAKTIYHWASITKTMTGIAIMQLRDRGRLSLDDPIVKYVPELMAVHDPYGPMEAITLRQLMSHSAGFRNPTWPWRGNRPWAPYEPTEWAQLVAMMPYTEILFPPGSKYGYSNPGIIFLGRVIQKLSGDDFEVYVDKNILKPLGMTHSYFDISPYHLVTDRSNNYEVEAGKAKANGLDFDTGITVSNGGLNAPITDMAKYFAFLLGEGPGAAGPVPVLKRASLEEMWRPVLPASDEEAMGDSVALSFFVKHAGGYRLIGHTGSQRGFRAFFYLEPGSGTAVVAATNTAPADERPGAHPDIAAIREGIVARLTKEVWPLFR
ncbi:MAG TPA: serine hydrolase domain-containing protein [Gemmatimonadales bacterium]|jgi:CubicO group peptidase (beta-lactamase class C family)|nr:serine hydrolase domain-containing protein [Gemmatimonadales bacterium]